MGRLTRLDRVLAARLGISRRSRPTLQVFSPFEDSLYVDLGEDVEETSSRSGLTVEDLLAAHNAGLLKSLAVPRGLGLRFDPAEVDRFVRELAPVELTAAHLEELVPAVEAFGGTYTEPGILDGWSEGMRHTEARETAAVRAMEREFQESISHLPKPKITVDESGSSM